MMTPSGERALAVPEPLAQRLDRMVAAGEFPTFEAAGAAMLELGIMEHDGHVLPPGGPSPPPTTRDIMSPGQPGAGQPGPAVRASTRG